MQITELREGQEFVMGSKRGKLVRIGVSGAVVRFEKPPATFESKGKRVRIRKPYGKPTLISASADVKPC